MLKITETSQGTTLLLRLDGQVSGTWVELLREACGKAPVEELDLAGVDFADREGARLLIDLRDRGVSLVGCSPFVETLLDMPGRTPR